MSIDTLQDNIRTVGLNHSNFFMTQELFEKYGPDPIALCQKWYKDAQNQEVNDPDAVCLATAAADGTPSNRMVLIKSIDEKGFKSHTNSNSRKGEELAENPKASMCWYWKSTRKQIRIVGKVQQVSDAEADEYFASRPRSRQVGAWASDQSSTFEKWEDLEASIEKYEKQFAAVDNIPRPEYWNGYVLVPHSIEFWLAHKDRLHTRFIYEKDKAEGWTAHWLYP